MKIFLLLLIFVFGTVHTGLAQTSASGVHTPSSTSSADPLKAKVSGTGMCQVVFDAAGHVATAVMTKSTGSKILDANTINYAQKNWTGKPNTKANVPILYKPSPAKYQNLDQHIYAPKPPFPYQARQKREHGRGTVQVTFDEQGHPVKAVMAKSTGSTILDGNTVNFVLKAWKYPPGQRMTVLAPVDYDLR